MTTKKEIKEFLAFRKRIYKGDGLYVGSADFILHMLLYKSTEFARSCEIEAVDCTVEGERAAQALWIRAPRDRFAQVAYFDCKRGESGAAANVIDKCEELTRKCGLGRTVFGLCGHLSYGVGILTDTELKNTFDTCYNKTFYAEYFAAMQCKHTLAAYRNRVNAVRAVLGKIHIDTAGYAVRKADFKRFEAECELMRTLCDSTVGQTYLYAPTERGHFYELLKDMKPILDESNLLFLTHGGKEVGFLFWHPDYNGAVKAGKSVSDLSFALSCILRRKRIDTVKLNSIGVQDAHRGKGTYALLKAMDEAIGDRYEFVETNFVWDENTKSRLMNERYIGGVCRRFAVYEHDTGI